METHVCRDPSDASHSTTEPIFIAVRNQATEDGVDVESRLLGGEIVEAEPEARHSVGGV
jgi:hypothetical protein